MSEATARLQLPMLVLGQGQKDVTHNEALLALDVLVQGSVVSMTATAPPADPVLGSCWLVPAGATGDWAGRAGQLASWTQGGWRYVRVPEGGSVWVSDAATRVRAEGGSWVPEAPLGAPRPAVSEPTGGSVVDVEARAVIGAILGRLQQMGLLST
jgi:hypothetical protein